MRLKRRSGSEAEAVQDLNKSRAEPSESATCWGSGTPGGHLSTETFRASGSRVTALSGLIWAVLGGVLGAFGGSWGVFCVVLGFWGSGA